MTVQELAKLLHGREYMKEITSAETDEARVSNLLVVTGYSDDTVSLFGFASNEIDAYEGAEFKVDKFGARPRWFNGDEKGYDEAKAYFERESLFAISITALWCASEGEPAWTFNADCPFETFDILEDDEVFSRGIVIDCSHLVEATP